VAIHPPLSTSASSIHGALRLRHRMLAPVGSAIVADRVPPLDVVLLHVLSRIVLGRGVYQCSAGWLLGWTRWRTPPPSWLCGRRTSIRSGAGAPRAHARLESLTLGRHLRPHHPGTFLTRSASSTPCSFSSRRSGLSHLVLLRGVVVGSPHRLAGDRLRSPGHRRPLVARCFLLNNLSSSVRVRRLVGTLYPLLYQR